MAEHQVLGPNERGKSSQTKFKPDFHQYFIYLLFF